MRWWIYQALFAVVYVALLPRFLLRMCRRGGYANRFADRFGHYPREVSEKLAELRGKAVWIHAVSVGEVYVAAQMMAALREQMPDIRFVFSTTSSTGWTEASQRVTDRDVLIYCPLDFPPCVKRALDAVQPRAFILTETEIWPNLIRSCHRRGIPLFLINARVSDHSAPGYRRLRYWFGPVLRMFTRIFAQSEQDRDRLTDAGADPETVEVTGSFKFDTARRAPEKEKAVRVFLDQYGCGGDRRVLLGGSTWPGEDEILVTIYQKLRSSFPRLRLVLVPRHFEKADAVQATVERAGFVCVRKSKLRPTPDILLQQAMERGDGVIVADTTGELMGFYGNARIAFVGKTMCEKERGGQNMIEPCLCGCATITGPHTENFRPVMADLLASDAVLQVAGREKLTAQIWQLLSDDQKCESLGARAVAAVEKRRGVVSKCAREMLALLEERKQA